MKETERFSVTVNGNPGEWKEHVHGTLEVRLDPGKNEILIVPEEK